jgi:ribosomal protein S18 acetylase RimI-like enzyme
MAYDPTQPRDPKGKSTGGRWTKDGSKAGEAARAGAGLGTPSVVGNSMMSVDILLTKGKKAGYVQYKLKGTGLYINEIVVDEEYRRLGLATKIVKELMFRTGATHLAKTVLTPAGRKLFDALIEKGIRVKE